MVPSLMRLKFKAWTRLSHKIAIWTAGREAISGQSSTPSPPSLSSWLHATVFPSCSVVGTTSPVWPACSVTGSWPSSILLQSQLPTPTDIVYKARSRLSPQRHQGLPAPKRWTRRPTGITLMTLPTSTRSSGSRSLLCLSLLAHQTWDALKQATSPAANILIPRWRQQWNLELTQELASTTKMFVNKTLSWDKMIECALSVPLPVMVDTAP